MRATSVNRTVNPCSEHGCPYRAEFIVRRAPDRTGRRSELPEVALLCMEGVHDEMMVLEDNESLVVVSIPQSP